MSLSPDPPSMFADSKPRELKIQHMTAPKNFQHMGSPQGNQPTTREIKIEHHSPSYGREIKIQRATPPSHGKIHNVASSPQTPTYVKVDKVDGTPTSVISVENRMSGIDPKQQNFSSEATFIPSQGDNNFSAKLNVSEDTHSPKKVHEIPIQYSSATPKQTNSAESTLSRPSSKEHPVKIEHSLPQETFVHIEQAAPSEQRVEVERPVPIHRSFKHEHPVAHNEKPVEFKRQVPIQHSFKKASPVPMEQPIEPVVVEKPDPLQQVFKKERQQDRSMELECPLPAKQNPSRTHNLPLEHTVPLTIQTSTRNSVTEDTRSHDSGITSRGSSWQSENFGRGQTGNYSPGSYATLPVKKSQQKVVPEPDYDDAEFHSYSTLPNFKKNQGHRGYESEAEVSRRGDFRSKWAPQRTPQVISEGYATDVDFFVRDNRNIGKASAKSNNKPVQVGKGPKPFERDYMSDLNNITKELMSGVDAYFGSKGKSSQKYEEKDPRSEKSFTSPRENQSFTSSLDNQSITPRQIHSEDNSLGSSLRDSAPEAKQVDLGKKIGSLFSSPTRPVVETSDNESYPHLPVPEGFEDSGNEAVVEEPGDRVRMQGPRLVQEGLGDRGGMPNPRLMQDNPGDRERMPGPRLMQEDPRDRGRMPGPRLVQDDPGDRGRMPGPRLVQLQVHHEETPPTIPNCDKQGTGMAWHSCAWSLVM
jgi:hypothetical protein